MCKGVKDGGATPASKVIKSFDVTIDITTSMCYISIQMKPCRLHRAQFQEEFYGGAPAFCYDLWRLENGKAAEHWDVMETIAAKESWQNQNSES